MSIRIVRLGSPRSPGEGLRLGTVRRPPRGVPKSEYASRDLYDVWFPLLAPSEALLHEVRGAHDECSWKRFVRKFKAEMKASDPARSLDLLAALSHSAQLAVGCYCAEEARCHRGVLRELLAERGARIETEPPYCDRALTVLRLKNIGPRSAERFMLGAGLFTRMVPCRLGLRG